MKYEKLYVAAFRKYIMEQLDIEKYDNELAESDLRFIAVVRDEQCDMQKNDILGLKYIYMANALHIERLNKSQMSVLKTAINQYQSTNEIPNEAMELVNETFQDIIAPKPIYDNKEESEILTSYKQGMNPDMVTMDSIVFYIATACEYDEEGNFVNFEHEKEKEKDLAVFASRMEKELKGALGDTSIRVFVDDVF